MAQCRVHTATIVGVDAVPVEVEVDVGAGIPSFSIVGLADIAVLEARERVRSALRASGFELPNARIVVNLAPGPLRKHGTGFDLPIALGVLGATKQLSDRIVANVLAVGELSLDGRVRAVPGMIAHALGARRRHLPLLGPNGAGRVALEGLAYLPLKNLARLRQGLPDESASTESLTATTAPTIDFADVVGQELAVRALVIAAAGAHHAVMVGPPGSGKTMLARRLATILPPLTYDETLETALVHSVAGLDPAHVFCGVRPFRAPHHSATVAGLVGGGSPPRPGEASLAHHGVLFLDEMPEFGPAALQCLRQPLEDGSVGLVRAEGRITFPARFALIGAANPCPCGFLGDPVKRCTCLQHTLDRYRSRIGGPLMDRVDLVVDVERPDPGLLLAGSTGQTSLQLRQAVMDARERSLARSGCPTSALTGGELLEACALSVNARASLEQAARVKHLSGRAVTRLLRVARTIADLEASQWVMPDHLAEALGYRATGRL